MQRNGPDRLALAAVLAGAVGIGFAPILVRLSDAGLVATAFYRLLFALPVLGWWMQRERRRAPAGGLAGGVSSTAGLRGSRVSAGMFFIAGVCFTGDLALWHWALGLTTVANATLLTNFTPFFVMIGARLLFGERITPALVAGLTLALVGGSLLVGESFEFRLERVWGDALAVVAAVFYAGYLLAVKHLRRTASTATILFRSGLVSCPLFLGIAALAGETMAPQSARGWAVVVALAWISHLGGQGLIAYALAHLPAGFSAVSLLLQPVVAAALAWGLLGEPLSARLMVGGVLILLGIAVAARGRKQGG